MHPCIRVWWLRWLQALPKAARNSNAPRYPPPNLIPDSSMATDYASILFFAGAVLALFNWATMSLLREKTANAYFYALPADEADRGQITACIAGIGMTMGSLLLITIAVLEQGPPSANMMYAAGFMHLLFFIDQATGLAKDNLAKVRMPKGPIVFWAVVNAIWSALSFVAAASDRSSFEGSTVFGWNWNILFKITGALLSVDFRSRVLL